MGYPVPQSVPRCPSAHEPAPQHCCVTDTANTSLRSHSPTHHTLPGSPTHKELSCGNMAVFSLLKDQCLDFPGILPTDPFCLERVKGPSMHAPIDNHFCLPLLGGHNQAHSAGGDHPHPNSHPTPYQGPSNGNGTSGKELSPDSFFITSVKLFHMVWEALFSWSKKIRKLSTTNALITFLLRQSLPQTGSFIWTLVHNCVGIATDFHSAF